MPQISIQVRVPFPDVDSSGRIHFTAMLRYMERAEHELMRSLGFPYAHHLAEFGFPRVHVACDFRGAVRYDDQLSITARVERVGRSSWSLTFSAHMLYETNSGTLVPGEPVAEGQMTIVTVDLQTERSMPLPDGLRAVLTGA